MVGNKADLDDKRKVPEEEAVKFAEDYEIDYFKETSAKTGLNTQEIFVQAAKLLYREYNELKKLETQQAAGEKLTPKAEKKKKNCC